MGTFFFFNPTSTNPQIVFVHVVAVEAMVVVPITVEGAGKAMVQGRMVEDSMLEGRATLAMSLSNMWMLM